MWRKKQQTEKNKGQFIDDESAFFNTNHIWRMTLKTC
jgi:hypothetical protein